MKTQSLLQQRHTILFVLSVILMVSQTHAQYFVKPKPMIGVGAFYNFQTESTALDVRFKMPLNKNFGVTPRFSYYFPGNRIHEYYAGFDLNYLMMPRRKVQPYLLAGVYYNNWINFEQYGAAVRKKNNVVVEGGCGLLFNLSCRLKPYLEWRYDTKWREGSLGVGLFLSFGKCGGSGNGKCPAYPKSY